MKKLTLFVGVFFAVLFLAPFAKAGFDQYGYNNIARIFNGTGSSWCLAKGLPSDCLGIYSPDKLVMKWIAEWDRGNAENWLNPPYGAWENNEWNGMKRASGAVWHYKIVWVGDCVADPTLVPVGGYCIWGQFATIMDQGKDPNIGLGHLWFAHASPTGYGSYKWKEVDSFTVPVDSPDGAMSNITLNIGSKYLIKVNGTAYACNESGCVINFDAEYSTSNGSNWVDGVAPPYTSYGLNLLDLKVNDNFVDWGGYNAAHVYSLNMNGNGLPVNLKIYDVYYPNNTGSLAVTIYELK